MIPFRIENLLSIFTTVLFLFIVPASWPQADRFIFSNLTGPDSFSAIPEYENPFVEHFSNGSVSRMAIFVTDTSSTWLGLVHGLKSIGIPFVITTDVEKATKHKVVFVYPRISGSLLSQHELQALADIPRNGGSLIGSNVLGGLQENFGFEKAIARQDHFLLHWNSNSSPADDFTHSHEQNTRIGDPTDEGWRPGSYYYTSPEYPPVATYDDGTVAIAQKSFEEGNAYALGLDLGFFFQVAFNGRLDTVARSYVDGYEPSVDVFLRFLKKIYCQGESDAVTLGTVPFGKSLTVIISHDVDFHQSLVHSPLYAEYEKSQNIEATFFIQTKYMKDYYDVAFFNEEGIQYIEQLNNMGMEIASHSVAHSPVSHDRQSRILTAIPCLRISYLI